MKADIIPLKEELTIIEASGKTLEVLGTVQMFLETDNVKFSDLRTSL